ncbi:hypothetical protein FTO70_03175 [Methanosarcina sp. KYL-1]|uniref:DUF7289 family protein n=1 Tax=Methanosarcina sp. KYL-1 TaxID=2602068 RepID=UPI002100D988|nr:hypothetical protein [Methanosarcina sp. KYL-1]MCQ1534709.1 hypothetical protein [Methanosarcina sp. KYL-1]
MKEKNPKSSQVNKPLFLRSESASSTVVGAVLLLAIIVMVLSVIRLSYIPEWKNDAEYSHMNDVWGDMADLKSKIDLMTIILASDPATSNTEITMSIPFHMGGGDVPLIGPIKSSGTLSVNKDNCNMTVIPNEGNKTKIRCGTISYSSQNRYYVDQNFVYEGGALILSQGEQSSMMLYPSIRFSRVSAKKYNVSIHAVEIYKQGYIPSDIVSSNTGCSLRLTGREFKPLYDSMESSNDTDSFTLTINTNYPDAWDLYLKETMADARVTDYDIDKRGNSVSLTFPSGSSGESLERLQVSKTVIKAEPGIGI